MKKVSKKKHKKRVAICRRAPRKVTLKDIAVAAHALGLTVEVSLVPKEPPKHEVPVANWPGDPSCRTVLAHLASEREIAQVFNDNPSSRWVITPHVIEERGEFTQRVAVNKKPKPETKTT